METINIVENSAFENQNHAKSEKELANQSKKMAKIELKRTKARESLIRNELEIARIRLILAEKNRALIEKKQSKKKILKYSEDILNSEKKFAEYNETMHKAEYIGYLII